MDPLPHVHLALKSFHLYEIELKAILNFIIVLSLNVDRWETDILLYFLPQFSRSFASWPSDLYCTVEIILSDFMTASICTVWFMINGPNFKQCEKLLHQILIPIVENSLVINVSYSVQQDAVLILWVWVERK
jgi:hypothetical protein